MAQVPGGTGDFVCGAVGHQHSHGSVHPKLLCLTARVDLAMAWGTGAEWLCCNDGLMSQLAWLILPDLIWQLLKRGGSKEE